MTPTLRPATLHGSRRRAASLALVVAMAAALVGAWGAAPAEATSYRFWSYWTGGSDWTFSSQGASRRPPDGGVDGWRFAISPASSSTIPPRHSPSFDKLCGGTPAQDGRKRVGLVVDFGTTQDAPDGESPPARISTCAVVPDDANGYEVLMTVAQLRTDSGLICGINGYPANECGVAVPDPTTSPTQQPQQGGGQNNGQDSSGTGSGGGSTGASQEKRSGGGAASGATSSPDDQTHSNSNNDRSDDKRGEPTASESAKATPEVSDDASAAAATATTATAGSASSGSPLGLIVGVVLILGIGAAAFAFTRRRT
ncbi:MAG: SCO2322 family protein [Actinomycetes bacterium]